MRFFRIGFIAAIVLAVSGCGADKQAGSIPDGAEFAPVVPAYIWASTDPDGEQWQAGERLLERFPGREVLFADARKSLAEDDLVWERDVEPALPENVNIVWLDFENGGSNFVVYAKPRDEAKLNKLLETGDNPPAHRTIEGWTVIAEEASAIDRFETARKAGSLADEESFTDAMEKLPDDAAARGWVSGKSIQAEFDRAAAESDDAEAFKQFSKSFGTLQSVSFSGLAEDDGIKIEAAYQAEDQPETGNFSAELEDTLPTGALAYVSFGNLEDFLDGILDSADKNFPQFKNQRGQMEQALGFSLKADLFPLFSKEGAIAVYREPNELQYPIVLFTLRVPDEGKAKRVVDRFAALAALSGMTARPFTVQGAEGKELVIPGAVSIFAVVTDGKAFVSNSKEQIEEALGDANKLADDPVYQAARDASGAPDETAGFIYLNLKAGLPYIFDFAAMTSGEINPEVTANTKPLESALLYAERDGDRTSVSGFLTIK